MSEFPLSSADDPRVPVVLDMLRKSQFMGGNFSLDARRILAALDAAAQPGDTAKHNPHCMCRACYWRIRAEKAEAERDALKKRAPSRARDAEIARLRDQLRLANIDTTAAEAELAAEVDEAESMVSHAARAEDERDDWRKRAEQAEAERDRSIASHTAERDATVAERARLRIEILRLSERLRLRQERAEAAIARVKALADDLDELAGPDLDWGVRAKDAAAKIREALAQPGDQEGTGT